ncbi:MAG: hypothetical protein IJC29_02980, partial [Clostridia bacterium]|nr:hypothetical protein [Clostridia bacterium]
LEEAKRRHQAVVVHFRTTKGKGYPEAEKLPDEYHCIYPAQGDTPHFYQAFGEELVRMGEEDEAICAVTPATGCTTGLVAFGERFPERTFDVGIAEAHALTFSAGLATMGYKPYAVIYSSFLQRGYDQLIHDIALQNLPVHLIVDRASLAPADGPTHHGIYDVSFLSQVPNVEILAPATLGSLRAMLRDTREATHPTAIRYANTAEDPALSAAFYPDGDWEHYGVRGAGDLTEEAQVILVSYGRAASRAWEALGQLQEEGIRCGMLLLERLTSHAEVAQEIARAVPKGVPLVFFEEGIYHGGAGMCLSQALRSTCPETPTSVLAVVNPLAQPTSPCDLYEFMGISTRDLVTRAREIARK